MGNPMGDPESPRLSNQSVEKGHGIRPTGHGNQQSASGGDSAAVQQGTSNGSGQRIQAPAS